MKQTIIMQRNSSGASEQSVRGAINKPREVFEFYLKTLAPVHIGCDEVYEPMNFVMDESSGTMTVFDSEHFLESLSASERNEFSGICKEGSISSILKIYKFINKHKPQGRKVQVSPGLLEHYRKTLGLPQNNERLLKNELNRFMISRTSFLPTTDRPYIPGSAIKGAFRTAYLNYLADSGTSGQMPRHAGDLEKNLMGGSFSNDPFRFLKISDFMPVGAVETKVVYAINEKKKTSQFDARGPYQILEVISPGSVFKGALSIEFPLKDGQVSKPLESDKLFACAKKFFGNARKVEEDTLRRINVQSNINPDAKTSMLRIGRHSGAESLTIEKFRNIKIMRGRGEQAAYGTTATTVWLASPYDKRRPQQNLEPFGWVKLVETSKDKMMEMDEIEAAWRKSFEENQASIQSGWSQKSDVHIQPKSLPKTPVDEVWNAAILSWDPGRRQVVATLGTKKAFVDGTDLIPESLQKAVVQKKKATKANVTVNSSYRIIKIEPV